VKQAWGRSIVHLAACSADAFGTLVDLDDLERVVTLEGNARIARYDDDTPPGFFVRPIGDQYARARALRNALAAGFTVSALAVQRHVGRLDRLCRGLERELSARVGVNAYVTPSSARGFRRHADEHHVVVLQIHGEKRWSIWAPGESQPTELVLHTGDALYVPRRWQHAAVAGDAASAHVTLGITSLGDGGLKTADAPVDPGIAPGWLRAVLTDLSGNTILERSRPLRWTVTGSMLTLHGGLRHVELAAAVAPALRRLQRRQTLRPSSRPALLSPDAWRYLLRTLLEAGLYTPRPRRAPRGRSR
jgi:hypothetical protein